MAEPESNLFERYLQYLQIERSASAYTIRNYRSDLQGNTLRGEKKGFFQFLQQAGVPDLSDVDRHVIRKYIAWLMEQNIARPSIARKLSAVRSFFRFLVHENRLPFNPMDEVDSPKLDKRLPDFLTVEEIASLLKAPDTGTPVGKRDRAIMELLYASGMRVSELAGLTLGQIRLDSREMRVMGKGSKERMVLMGAPAASALTDYLQNGRPALLNGRKDEAVFINTIGQRIQPRAVQKMLIEYAGKAGIDKKVHPHMLRHTFATHMLNGGADLRVVQELLGHTRLGTTQIYTHVTKNQVKKVYLASHPFARDDEKKNEH